MIPSDCSILKEELTKANNEIDRLQQENKQLRKEIDQLQRIQEIVPPIPKYGGIQKTDLVHAQEPLHQIQSHEPRFASQLFDAEVTKLKEELGQIKTQLLWTQAELQLIKGNAQWAN